MGSTTKTQTKRQKHLDHEMLVSVMNCSPGVLIYTSPRTHAVWRLDEYGGEQLMPLQELINIRSQYPRYFRDQWLIVMDAEVINYLRLDEYYKNALTPEELNEFFDKSPEEIKDFLAKATGGAKMLIAGHARKKFESGELSDIHKIRAVTKTLGIMISDIE